MKRTKWIWIGILTVGAVALTYSARQLGAQCCGGGHNHAAMTASQPASQPATAPSKAKFANARCPIMGGAIDPNKVPDSLTRDYKGQKVAFCCGGCPGAWDKLTPEQKDAKLKAATDSK